MSEWISVKDRLPEESGTYLAYTEYIIYVLKYSAIHKLFNVYDSFEEETAQKLCINVTHWMPLPEPPKEAAYV